MEKPESATVDYSAQAIKALERVERESDAIESIVGRVKVCREAWRDYGAALLGQRQQMPSDNEFGGWIKFNGLDHGRAAGRAVRADAMWLAENWSGVYEIYTGTQHHPTNIRQECRELGLAWAGETQHQKNRKANAAATKKARKPRKPRATQGWIVGLQEWWVANHHEPLPEGWRPDNLAHKTRGGKRALLEEALGRPINPQASAEQNEALGHALEKILAQQRAANGKSKLGDIRGSVKESQRQKFDRAVERGIKERLAQLEEEYRQKHEQLRVSYEAAVDAEVQKRLTHAAQDRIARAERMRKLAEDSEHIWRGRMQTARGGITLLMENWRMLAACLHPDRAPDDRREKFTEASTLLNNVRDAMKFANYKEW